MTPADGRVSQKGREILTAIISAALSGLAIGEAYEHQLNVWRRSEEGAEIIESFNQIDETGIQMLDIRYVLSGKPPTPAEDLFRFLYDTMNAAELDMNRNLEDLDDSVDEGDAASVKSQEPPEWLQTEEELAAIRAAEEELKSMGRLQSGQI